MPTSSKTLPNGIDLERLTIRVPAELKEKIRLAAQEENVSVALYLNAFLAEAFDDKANEILDKQINT